MVEEINWATEAARAKRMTIDQLQYAIADAREAWACAEEFGKMGLANNAGKYADQISVYSRELARRTKKRRYTRRKN